MTHLLLVDDEPLLTEPLARRLRSRGYTVTVADNGKTGLDLARTTNPDLVVLDIMMPEMDGWEVCRQLRETSIVPILMLTALDDDFDRITGLELGADDYVAKPFSMNVLLARIQALLRRVQFDKKATAQKTQSDLLTAGDVKLNLATREAFKNDRSIELRYKEFELLSLLLSTPNIPVTRAQIFDEVWGTDWLGDTRTLDVHIRWLREKLEENPSKPERIMTVRNVGYVFKS